MSLGPPRRSILEEVLDELQAAGNWTGWDVTRRMDTRMVEIKFWQPGESKTIEVHGMDLQMNADDPVALRALIREELEIAAAEPDELYHGED